MLIKVAGVLYIMDRKPSLFHFAGRGPRYGRTLALTLMRTLAPTLALTLALALMRTLARTPTLALTRALTLALTPTRGLMT